MGHSSLGINIHTSQLFPATFGVCFAKDSVEVHHFPAQAGDASGIYTLTYVASWVKLAPDSKVRGVVNNFCLTILDDFGWLLMPRNKKKYFFWPLHVCSGDTWGEPGGNAEKCHHWVVDQWTHVSLLCSGCERCWKTQWMKLWSPWTSKPALFLLVISIFPKPKQCQWLGDDKDNKASKIDQSYELWCRFRDPRTSFNIIIPRMCYFLYLWWC